MARQRSYRSEYAARNERAKALGFRSYQEQRKLRKQIRESTGLLSTKHTKQVDNMAIRLKNSLPIVNDGEWETVRQPVWQYLHFDSEEQFNRYYQQAKGRALGTATKAITAQINYSKATDNIEILKGVGFDVALLVLMDVHNMTITDYDEALAWLRDRYKRMGNK